MRLVEGISPQYLLSVIYISGDLFIYGDLASTFTSVRGGSFEVLGFFYHNHTVDLTHDCSHAHHLYRGFLVA